MGFWNNLTSNFSAGKAARVANAVADPKATMAFRWGQAGLIKGPLKVLGIAGLAAAIAGTGIALISSMRSERRLRPEPSHPQNDMGFPPAMMPDMSYGGMPQTLAGVPLVTDGPIATREMMKRGKVAGPAQAQPEQ